MKRTHLNAVLLLVVAGLGVAVYLGERKDEKKGAPLTALSADALKQIALEHPQQPRILLEKQGDDWQLVEPIRAPTDPYEVSGITALANLETKRSFASEEVQPKELGLDPAQYRVVLNDTAIEFGDQQPLEGRRYVRSQGNIFLVDDPPSAALDADYADLVAKSLIPAGAELVKIELPSFTVHRTEDGKIWAVSPAQEGVAPDAAVKLANAWKEARAMWNAQEPAEGSTGEAVTLHLKDGTAVRLIVVERDPQLVLARPDWKLRYTLSKALENELLQLARPTAPAAQAETPSQSAPKS